jgi:hypothetical protein
MHELAELFDPEKEGHSSPISRRAFFVFLFASQTALASALPQTIYSFKIDRLGKPKKQAETKAAEQSTAALHKKTNQSRNQSGRAKHCRTPKGQKSS